ncbi:lipoprotein [Myroides sp. JBRI-B21084]
MRKIFIPITILLMISACSQSSKNCKNKLMN